MEVVFEVVPDRPKSRRGDTKKPGALNLAVRATADSGGAVRVPLNGVPARKTYSRFAYLPNVLKKHGFRLRTGSDSEFLYLWSERINGGIEQPADLVQA